MTTVELLLAAGADVAEAPHWDEAEQHLLWVDAPRGEVHRFDPATGVDRVVFQGSPVAAATPRTRGGLVVADADSFLLLDAVGRVEARTSVTHRGDDLALNDGKCDPTGRFWAGSGADETPEGLGQLYSLERDGSLTTRLEHVSLSNGLDWSPDGRRMYYVDTRTSAVDVFEFSADTGAIDNRRRLIEIPPEQGLPDGLTVDNDEGIWVALWGGGQVRRYTPTGSIDQVISVPRVNTTSCAFGGQNRRRLFITAASDDGPTSANGALFGVEMPYEGQRPRSFAG